jgi:4-methylaminobutanoate oxidase (formaldehyde-forming)
MGLARAHRVTYVGELGWELYVSADQAAHVFETLWEAGADHGLTLCGLHTLDSCRIEKAFRHFGHDITDEDHVLEAGLGFAVKPDKGDFIGREAVLRKKEAGLSRRLFQFRLTEPDAMLFHNEAVLRDGEIVSITTSGNYGHALGGAVGLGYVPCAGESAEQVLASTYEIEIAGRRVRAEASLRPLYDPKAERVRM